MGKVLNVYVDGPMSVAVGYDRTIYVWGYYFHRNITQPFRTKFSRIFDAFAHSGWRRMHTPLIVHDSSHTVRITNHYNYKYAEEALNILESLEAAFDDPVCFILFCMYFFALHIVKLSLYNTYFHISLVDCYKKCRDSQGICRFL